MKRRFVLVAAAIGLTGCAGPQVPLSVGNHAMPLSLVLGARPVVETAPTGPVTLIPTGKGPQLFVPPQTTSVVVTQQSQPIKVSLPPVHVGKCPPFDPLAPVAGTSATISHPPAHATYGYRVNGSVTAGKATQKLPKQSRWTVRTPSRPDSSGRYSFDVVVKLGKQTTTRTFLVVPTGLSNPLTGPEQLTGEYPPVNPALPDQPGLYLQKVQEPSGSTFTPSPPLPIVNFPIATGNAFTATASDGSFTEEYTSTVGKPTKVNACGKPVQGWEIKLTGGEWTQATTGDVASFSETLVIGTQYGGLPIADSSKVSETAAGGSATRNESFTINIVPTSTERLPKR